MEGYSALAYEIVYKAIFDYRKLKNWITFDIADRLDVREYKEIERFFDSAWCEFLCQGTLDKEIIYDQLTKIKPVPY